MSAPFKSALHLRRAADALRRAQDVRGTDIAVRYRSYVDRLGPSILINGLGQAIATERAAAANGNGGDARAHARLYKNLTAWLCGEARIFSEPDLIDAIVSNDQSRYLRAHVETVAWLAWHKKFCQAYLPRATSSVGDD